MKKFLAVLAFAGLSMSGFAQDATPTQQYSVATNSFWSNWFIEAGADWNAWYSGEEHGQNFATSPFKKFRSNAGASVSTTLTSTSLVVSLLNASFTVTLTL